MDSFSFGLWCEELVAQHLECVRGWRVLSRRVRFKGGEVDLIAESMGGDLFFIEVKGRRNAEFGAPIESMTEFKLFCLRRTALEWKRRVSDFRDPHFLFVGVEIKEGSPLLDWQEF